MNNGLRAQKTLVERFLEWDRVRTRLETLPAVRSHFPLKKLERCADRRPYYCHYLAWRLGTWSSDDVFVNFDRLLALGSSLSGWESEFRSFASTCQFATFWSLLWQLQVAAYFIDRKADVCWNSKGPDLKVTTSSGCFFVECYSYRKSFGIMEFVKELCGQLDPRIRVEHVPYLPLSLPQNSRTDDFLHELFSPYLDPGFLKQAHAQAAKRWPVHLPVPNGIGNFSVFLEGESLEAFMPDGVGGMGDPDNYLQHAVDEGMSQKREENSLGSHRPNILAVNYALGHDFETASLRQQQLGERAPTMRIGDPLDAVILACCGVNRELPHVRLLTRCQGHPAAAVIDDVQCMDSG